MNPPSTKCTRDGDVMLRSRPPSVRKADGVAPYSAENAFANACWLSYPASTAMSATGRSVRNSRCAARSSRSRRTSSLGDSPTMARKMRWKWYGDRYARSASWRKPGGSSRLRWSSETVARTIASYRVSTRITVTGSRPPHVSRLAVRPVPHVDHYPRVSPNRTNVQRGGGQAVGACPVTHSVTDAGAT